MEHFALSAFRPLASDTVRLEIYFEDDLLDLMSEARDMHPVASYESVTLFVPPTRDGHRVEPTRYGTAAEFVAVIRDVDSTAIVLETDRQPLTQNTPGYFDVYEVADLTRGIILK